MEVVIAVDDPRRDDVQALLEAHLAFSRAVTPPGHVHALGIEGLLDLAVTFFSARRDGVLVGIGALKRLDDSHAEVKSMHTSEAARGQGVGRAMVDHLLAVAAARNYQRVSLETGTMDTFAPARSLCTKVGFIPCEPFGEYTANRYSQCMTMIIDPGARRSPGRHQGRRSCGRSATGGISRDRLPSSLARLRLAGRWNGPQDLLPLNLRHPPAGGLAAIGRRERETGRPGRPSLLLLVLQI